MYDSTLGCRGFMSWPSCNVCRISLCREFRDGACRFYLLFEQHGPRIARVINAAFEATKTCVSPMRHKPLFRYTESLLLGVMSIAATFISEHLFHETGGWEDPNKLKQHSTKASLESHVLQSTILTPTPYLCFFMVVLVGHRLAEQQGQARPFSVISIGKGKLSLSEVWWGDSSLQVLHFEGAAPLTSG